MDITELVEDFDFFETWEERYRYLIDLGKDLPPMDPALKVDQFRVRGCISQVWVVPRTVEGRLEFEADSDSVIVRGLVAVARILFFGKTPTQIADVETGEVFSKLGFDAHLSVNRRNGFQSMMKTIKAYAEAM